MDFLNSRVAIINDSLIKKYGRLTISKAETATEINIGLSTLSKYMSEGMQLPVYKKIGTSANSRVVFNTIDVANFLADTVEVA